MRAAALLGLALLTGCGTLGKLSEVGRPPAMTPSGDPTADPAYRPISLPMPRGQMETADANSLWRQGSRAFFKDQRAAQVGDIVTLLVNITDEANLKNETSSGRTGGETLGLPSLLGFERTIGANANPASLVSTNTKGNATGSGSIKRNESVTLRLAGVITQVLPNGNLAVAARQEVRVNNELRELLVSGVLRREDIGSDNTIRHDRLAEARIAYGGRGQLTDVQRARYGQQILDILLPF